MCQPAVGRKLPAAKAGLESARYFASSPPILSVWETFLFTAPCSTLWADDPENPYWCITICKNERTFLREWLVAVDAHTGECQWMHVDPYGYYQLGEDPGNG